MSKKKNLFKEQFKKDNSRSENIISNENNIKNEIGWGDEVQETELLTEIISKVNTQQNDTKSQNIKEINTKLTLVPISIRVSSKTMELISDYAYQNGWNNTDVVVDALDQYFLNREVKKRKKSPKPLRK